MPSYEYKGFDAQGRPRKGVETGSSPKDVRERLARQGLLAESLAPIERQALFPAALRAVAYREIAALAKAGMPLDRALALLADSPESNESRPLLTGIRDRILEGDPLSTAFQKSAKSCPPFELAILQAAEQSARTDAMLTRLADFIEAQEKLRNSIQSALMYPLLVLTLGICSAIVILGVLVPRMQDAFLGDRVELPGLTRFVLGLGSIFSHWSALPTMAILAALILWRVRAVLRNEEACNTWDRRLFKMPVVGKGYTMLVNLRFADTLSILIEGGLPLVESMAMAGRATGSRWIATLAATEAERIKHGKSMSAAVRAIPPLSSTLPGWIEVGEAGGGLESMLCGAASRYRDLWTRYIDRHLRLLEPAVILLMGGFVLFITLAILLPVFSMSERL